MRETTDADHEVGLRIRSLRTRVGLSQTALGEAIGVTMKQVQKYEGGVNRVPHNRLGIIAQILNCSIPDLLGIDQAPADQALFTLSEKAFALAKAYDRIPNSEVKAALHRMVQVHAVEP